MNDRFEQPDRLNQIKELLKRKKRNRNQICWIKFNPEADYSVDIHDAQEDIEWMIYEIERLRDENDKFKEFIAALRRQLEDELK